MEIKMFHARGSTSDEPKLNVSCRSVEVTADGGTCKYTGSRIQFKSENQVNQYTPVKLTMLSIIEPANIWDCVRGSGYFEIVAAADGFRIRLRDCKHQETQTVNPYCYQKFPKLW